MTNVWKEPIFDRTLDDVNFAIQKIKEWKQNHTHAVENDGLVTDEESIYDLKGCLNLSDLNRIECNITYLAEKLESFAFHPDVRGRQWTIADMPNQSDVSRIVGNIRSIIESFYQPSKAPSLPTTMLSYGDINAIEENLYLVKHLLDCMQNSFGKVGATRSGATMFLPIRR